jgi:glycosyltransferase involved in cell wall biosynthesis
MTKTLALDLTRLALGPARRAPRGIDRVEIAYARHFLKNWPGDCVAVLPMPWGVRIFDRAHALAGLAALEALWRETLDPLHDRDYLRTKSFLAGRAPGGVRAVKALRPTALEVARAYFKLLSATGIHVGQSAARALPPGAIYLNVGQLEIFRPFLSWLDRRPDVKSVFMIHDLTPLEHPDHHIERGIKLHERIVRNTAAFAHALIVPSHAVRTSVAQEMAKCGRGDLPIHVEHLPVPSEFIVPVARDPRADDGVYFIICGALDSYKNHMMLLKVWQEMVVRQGPHAPRLVIAGALGSTSQEVIGFIRHTPLIRGHVILAPALATQALRQLMIGARALLMPSLAEGFGLPIVEALAQGTPVLASDIPAHREAGKGGDVTFLAPQDGAKWLSAIEALAGTADAGDRAKAKAYKPKTWAAYFRGIEKFLSTMPASG